MRMKSNCINRKEFSLVLSRYDTYLIHQIPLQSIPLEAKAVVTTTINKDGPSFWKWRSRLNTRTKCNAVGGYFIANNFAIFFTHLHD